MGLITVSSKGQIVIPKEIREKTGIKEGTKLYIEAKEGIMTVRVAGEVSWKRWRGCIRGTNVLKELEAEHRREVEKDEKNFRRMGVSGMAKR